MKRVTPLVMSWLLVMTGPAFAQVLTGKIIGAVKDESGAVLPGVTVTLTSPDALPGGPLASVTDAQGEYRFPDLDRGAYALTVTLAGFSAYQEEGLQVAIGGTTERNVTLKLASVAETITVSGESPMVDPREVGVKTNLNREAIENLPTQRHNMFTDYAKWTPGVSAADPSGQGANISIMGSATDENSSLLDGASVDRPASGGSFASSDHDAMEEMQVITLGASAEYQLAQGGVVIAVSKSGTNSFKGDASAYWWPDSLLSKPIKVDCRCASGQTGFTNLVFRNYSAHAGGPIIKDRLWYFGGGNYDRRNQGTPGSDPAILVGRYSHATFAKIVWQPNDTLKFRITHQTDPYGGNATPTLERPFITLSANYGMDHVYAGEMTATLSHNMLLTARSTGWVATHYPSKPLSGDRVSPIHFDQQTGIACCGVASFNDQGTGRHGQAFKVNRYFQGARSTHDLRFGLQLEWAHYQSFTALPSGVNYNDLGGRPDQATFREPSVTGGAYRSQGAWVEDEVTFARRLTLSLGLRFDRMHAISPDLPAVNNNLDPTGQTIEGLGDLHTWKVWSPRIGFNLKLGDDGKTILRGNYGRAYRQIYTDDFTDVHPGISRSTLTRFNPATGGYTTIISVTDPTANIAVDPDLEAPFSDQFSVGLDREVIANVRVSATFMHKRSEKQIGWQDIGGVYGTRTEVLPDGRTLTVYPLLNATSARRFLRTNGPGTFSRYSGLILGLDKRWSQLWRGSVFYTYSKANGLVTTGQDPNDKIFADGRLQLDRPHMLTVMSLYEIPKIGMLVAADFQRVSGSPFAPQALVQLPQGRRSVNIEPAGAFRYPSQEMLNFLFSKFLFRRGARSAELIAELKNTLQDTAHSAVITRNFFSATFGQPSTWIEPRRMSIVARVKF
jgi:hypothetical protein